MSALAPNPQTSTGIGGAQDYSQYYLPQNMGIDSPPPGAYEDSQYLTDEAALRADISGQYQDELAYLGYTNDQGQYVPGSLLTDAQTNEMQYEQQRQKAILQNTQNAQQQGTLFSGMRAQQQAEAEAPWLGSIAGIEAKLPVDLSSHYEKAAGLVGSYNNQQAALLSSAAARQAAALAANPPATTTPPTDTTTPPPTDTTTPPPQNTAETIPTGPGGTNNMYSTLPYRSGTMPFQMFAAGGEVDGATPAVIGEQGPEAVVPRSTLSADENAQLTQLRQAAQLRMGGNMRRNDEPGIHWFGPGGSGVDYPPDNPGQPGWPTDVFPPPRRVDPPLPPPGFPGPGVRPPGWTPAHELFMQGHHGQAIDQWMAHHSGALAGHGSIPHWAQAAVHARLNGGPRMHAVPDPGYHPAGPFYMGPLGGGAYA
jgi:hypothetical protein